MYLSSEEGMKKLSHAPPHPTVFCLWNWKCDVTWTMTGVFVKDMAVTSNQRMEGREGDFPLLGVWLVRLCFSAVWRTLICQSGIQGAVLRCPQLKKTQSSQLLHLSNQKAVSRIVLVPVYTNLSKIKSNSQIYSVTAAKWLSNRKKARYDT